jgi:hypothetical protein
MAGANERAGFIDAPDMNAKKNMSKPTIPPIAIAPKPFSPFLCTTTKITAISRAEANTSTPNIKGRDMHCLELAFRKASLRQLLYKKASE